MAGNNNSGRNRLPTALARLNGNRRALRRDSLVLPAHVPVAPGWLSAGAKAEWDHLAAMLARMGVLTAADQMALALLADSLHRWKEITRCVDGPDGYVIPVHAHDGKEVGLKRSPYVSMQHEYGALVMRLLSQFGLTPSGRAGIRPVYGEDSDEDDFTPPPIDAAE